jgi:hypothetical protein
MVNFFFVRDREQNDRFFSSEPPRPISVKHSKAKAAWELAKKKLMLLPQRTLRQEQAFARALRLKESSIPILYSGRSEEKTINQRYHLFLHKQRIKRLFFLVGETLLLPFTALTMPLPGPNVTFYALVLLMLTHWQSLRGVRALLKKNHDFAASALLAEWEDSVAAGSDEARLSEILAEIEHEFHLQGLRKVLWK